MRKFGVEYHHGGEVVVFVEEITEWRDPNPLLIQPGRLATPQKETIVTKVNKET